ncbi:MAG: hypothetical protein ABSB41_15685 [Anaerolineales bacterium]
MKDQDLLARLSEDLGSPEEAAELTPVIRRLENWKAPAPAAEDTLRLTGTLYRLLKVHRKNTLSYRLHLGWLVLRSQPRVVQSELWTASAIVLALGTLVTLAYSHTGGLNVTLPFVLIAPVAAAGGIAFLYGSSLDPALEIELTTPISPRQVLFARLVLVFGFDLLFGLAGSAILSLLRVDISFLPLVSAWLAPMTFLASLAFLLMTMTLDSILNQLICLGLWILQNSTRLVPGIRWPFPFPDLTAAAARPWLWLVAVLLFSIALWLGGGEEHWMRKRA